jgi:outer membrane protein
MKKFILSMLLIIPLGITAQEMKIATVNTQAIFNIMPEMSSVESQIAKATKEFQDEMKGMEDEYNRKYSDLTAQGDTLTENIRQLRLQEIQDIQTRMENFVPMAQESMKKKQEELLAPILDKIEKAVKAVGDEQKYTYILLDNPQVVLFKGASAIDATDLVKAKLGLK